MTVCLNDFGGYDRRTDDGDVWRVFVRHDGISVAGPTINVRARSWFAARAFGIIFLGHEARRANWTLTYSNVDAVLEPLRG